MRKKSLLDAKNHVFFLEEILTEILSYVEAKSLLRFKSVCKLWYAVIRSKQLVELHMMRNGHRYHHMHMAYESLNSTDRIHQSIEYICDQGLVLSKFCVLSSFHQVVTTYRITNPTTKYSMDLPHPHKRDGVLTRSMRLFLNTCTGSYNVLYIYFDTEKKKRHVKLLDLGGQSNDPCPNTDLSWTSLNIPEFENVSPHQSVDYKYCMSTEGSSILYILDSPDVGKFKITCIDIVTLTCTTLDVPLNLHLTWSQVGFGLWRGKPSVVFIYQEELNILALEDYRTQKWADTKVFPLPFPEHHPYRWFTEPRISTTTDDTVEMSLCGDHSRLRRLHVDIRPRKCVYKLIKSKVVSSVPSRSSWLVAAKVAATLVSVRGMQPKKKEDLIKLYTAWR